MPRPNYGDPRGNWHERPSAHAAPHAENRRERSREMRQNMSLPEVLLWQRIRGEQLGYKFRRQHSIGPYFADFYCHELRCVVEVDGRFHDEQQEYDSHRTQYLESHGYTVIRLDAKTVLENPDFAAALVKAAMHRKFPNARKIEAE